LLSRGEIQQHDVRALLDSFEDNLTTVRGEVEVANVEVGREVGQLAPAENPKHNVFSGVINAYTPPSHNWGPYEIRGPWYLKLKCASGKADFSAALNMEFSDGWVLSKNSGDFDPTKRMAHTHHITLVDAEVTPIANGFRVNGPATFTLNGGAAPATIEPSQVVIEITGGTEVEFSNITLTFLAPGSNHFGAAPLPGVVQMVKEGR
jgi:hypothetical protein